MPEPQGPKAFKYWAFISYSHRDKKWADWLHRAVETYPVPGRLIGRASRDGKVPARLFPVFRDREELPTSGDLGSNIEAALRASRYLIVICSPQAAASRWVDQEIRTFKAMGRDNRVLCLIVDGEPNASERSGAGPGAVECFPPSLRFHVGADGALTERRAEPIAADARDGQDGKDNAKLKVVAGLLDVGFDELRQRDLERRRRQRVLVGASVLALAGVLFWQEHSKVQQLKSQLARVYYERGRTLREAGDGAGAALFFAESNLLAPSTEARANAQHYLDSTPLPRRVLEHDRAVIAVALSPGARAVAAVAADGSVRLWDAVTGSEWRARPDTEGQAAARSLAFTADGGLLLGGEDGAVRRWRKSSPRELSVLLRPDGPVTGLAVSPDGRTLATGRADGLVQLWSASGERLGEPLSGADGTLGVFFGADGRALVALGADGAVQSWDVATRRAVGAAAKPAAGQRPLAYDASSEGVLVVDADGAARLWDRSLQRPLGPALHHDGVVFAAAVGSSGRLTATGGSDYSVRLWDDHRPPESRTPLFGAREVAAAALSPDGSALLTVTADSAAPAAFWDPRTGESRHAMSGGSLVALSRGDAALTAKGAVFFVRGSYFRAKGDIRGVALSADGKSALTLELVNDKAARRLVFWDLLTGVSRGLVEDDYHVDLIFSAALSGDGRRFLASYLTSDGARTEIAETATRKTVAFLQDQESPAILALFSPDGAAALTAGDDGFAQLWDARTGRAIGRLLRNGSPVRSATFSDDGGIVATSGETLPARLWGARTGEPLGGPLGEPGVAVKALGFDASSGRLMAVAGDGVVRSWDVSWAVARQSAADLGAAARLAAGRRLDERGELEPLPPWERAGLMRSAGMERGR